MPSIQEVRSQYPQYSDLSDSELADALHSRYYSDIPKDEFFKKAGLQSDSGTAPSLLDQAINVSGRTARNTVQGIAALADLPNAAINAAISPFTDYKFGYPSQLSKQALDAAGVPDSQNKQERIVDSAARSVIPLFAGGYGSAPSYAFAGGALSGGGSQGAKEAGLSEGSQTAIGLLSGLAPTALAAGGSAALRAGGGILGDFLRPASQKNIGKILISQAENPIQAVDNLRTNNTQMVPESFPTTAEVSGDTGLISAQRGFENTSAALQPQRQANNAARNQYLDSITGSPADLQAAIASRRDATSPLFNMAKQDPVNANSLSPIIDQIDSAIADVGGHTDAGRALSKLRSDITDASKSPMQGPLIQTYREARDKASKTAMQDNGAYSDAVKGIVKPIVYDLNQSLESQSRNLLDANKKFREASRPIEQMETLQDIKERISNRGAYDTNGNPMLSQPKLGGILSNEGRKELGGILSTDQMGVLDNLQNDMKRQSVSQAYRPSGSDTAANLTFKDAIKDLASSKLDKIPLIGGMISNSRTNAIQNGLASAYGNPNVAADAMSQVIRILGQPTLTQKAKEKIISGLLGSTISLGAK